MLFYDKIMLKGLQKYAINTEIADINGRTRQVSLFVANFVKENGRSPSDQECNDRIMQLQEELKEVDRVGN